jgi:hypothetical protein
VLLGRAHVCCALQVLRQAVGAAVLWSHPTDTAADAACVIAAAAAWLCQAEPARATPQQLLQHLLAHAAQTDDMRGKLQLLQRMLPALAGAASQGGSGKGGKRGGGGGVGRLSHAHTPAAHRGRGGRQLTGALLACLAWWGAQTWARCTAGGGSGTASTGVTARAQPTCS